MKVAVVGASGYVGSRLVPELLRRGHDVVATRHRSADTAYPWSGDVEWRRVDVQDEDAVIAALDGVDTVCYLVHGLDDDDFMERDRKAADNVAYAVGVVGATRLVYFSGIVPDLPDDELSDHLLSRLEVEEVLATADCPVLTLRASMVIGAGSTSFEVMRQMSHRLGVVQTVPAWMAGSVIQPVAVADAVWFLAEALERPDVTGHLDVVGPDRLSYVSLLRTYAAEARLLRVQLPVWLAPVETVARVAGSLVDVPSGTVQSLIPSLGHDMVGELDAADVLGEPGGADGGRLGVAEAIRRSLATERAGDGDPDGAALDGDPQAPSAGDPSWSRHRSVLDWVWSTARGR
ncbi:NAD-dependent epimerase/dehydratase family protein [Terrabacter sp. 2RAF25]|uniref:NAD-dependent epimerase/dehydratase family protein n=1 Tax=Terrabacter sp. 2RAF25 TaxID=3232998 RepID=UPI003F9ABD54